MPGRGRFISLEGGEGAGKSTLAKALKAALSSQGHDVVLTREPGGTPNAEAIRELLVTGQTDRWSPMNEALLLYAARKDHVDRLIKPALEQGQWVITDRFADSTRAYQGVAGGLKSDQLEKLHQLVLGEFEPDLTLILDLDPEQGLKRTHDRGEGVTRFEAHELEFHHALRSGFVSLANSFPDRCILIDASQLSEAVLGQGLDAISKRLEIVHG